MKFCCPFLTLTYLMLVTSSCGGEKAADGAKEEKVVGWLEYVRIHPGKFKFKAKLDTGAKTSSINTTHYEIYKKNGETRVRFTVVNHQKKARELDAVVVRMVKIKEHEGKPQDRPVIKLGIQLGTIYHETQVNLVDRSRFIYPLLLGRRFISEAGLAIDPNLKFTVEPTVEADRKQ